MRDERLKHRRLFGEAPQGFTLRMERTLSGLPEKRRPRRSGRAILLAACLTLLLSGAALAAVQSGGLKWFYEKVFHAPPMLKDAMEDIQDGLPQRAEHPLLDLWVESAVWLPKDYDLNYPEDVTLEILTLAFPKDPGRYELHPMDKLDPDGLRDEREEDYLETEKGFGPVEEMMADPRKELLLYCSSPESMTLAPEKDPSVRLCVSFYYQTMDEAGKVASYFSFHVPDAQLARLKGLADANGAVTMVYTDFSWLYNKEGNKANGTRQGTVVFTMRLPEKQ